MITWIEHVFVLAFAIGWPVRAYLEYPGFRRRVRAGEPGARLAAYAEGMIVQWLFAAGAIPLGIRPSWDWSTLGLTCRGASGDASRRRVAARRPQWEVASKTGHTPLGTFDLDLGRIDGAQRLDAVPRR
jgi:hypothetical protein